MAKAMEAFRNIGEVSVELGVKKHVLRFWETKFPQLKPMKRGGGRRLYRPSDVQLLTGIRDLLQSTGYTIKGVQKILRDQGVEQVKKAAASVNEAAGRASRMAEAQPLRLTSTQVGALRSVVAELETCRQLLAVDRKAAAPRLKRPA